MNFFALIPFLHYSEMLMAHLALHQTHDHLTFINARKCIRILVEGVPRPERAAIRCVLNGATRRIRLNDVCETSTTVAPRQEQGRWLARFVINPAEAGTITATFSLEGDPGTAPLSFELEVRPEQVFGERPIPATAKHFH